LHLGRPRSGRQVDADAGAADRDGTPADEERHGGHHLEVDQRLDAHPADLAQVRMARDPDHERGKQQRRDDGTDQAEENLAEHTERDSRLGEIVSDLSANHHGDQDPCSQRFPRERERHERGNGQPSRRHEHSRRNGNEIVEIEDGKDRGRGEENEGRQGQLRHAHVIL
jgi:hypothetical protein